MWKLVFASTLGLALALGAIFGLANASKLGDIHASDVGLTVSDQEIGLKEQGLLIESKVADTSNVALAVSSGSNKPLFQVLAVKQPKQGKYCNGTSTTNHPKGDSLATKITDVYSITVSYDDVMGWFCDGYGFGEIDLAYYLFSLSQLNGSTTITSVADIFTMRTDGMGWGQIMKLVGYAGKSGKPHPQSQSSSSSSNSQGQGQGQSKGKGKPAVNPGKGKGKGKP